MSKRFISIIMTMILALSILGNEIKVQAEEIGEEIDYSYLMTDNALIGYADMQTWGVYLMSGHSIINEISDIKIGAGGATSAARSCEVSITSIVERQTSTGWAFVTSWTQTNKNAFSAMISRSLIVGTSNWYRVRSHHYAATDSSTSYTNALYMD